MPCSRGDLERTIPLKRGFPEKKRHCHQYYYSSPSSYKNNNNNNNNNYYYYYYYYYYYLQHISLKSIKTTDMNTDLLCSLICDILLLGKVF